MTAYSKHYPSECTRQDCFENNRKCASYIITYGTYSKKIKKEIEYWTCKWTRKQGFIDYFSEVHINT